MKFKDLIRSGLSACLNKSVVRIMRITLFIMTTFLLQVSAAGFAQKVTFNKKDVSLKQLFTEIRKQTGYNVFWQNGNVSEELTIDAAFNKTSLEEVLNKALASQALSYTIVNQTIVITKKEKKTLDLIKEYFSSINVTGKILDAETGKPVPKVSIKLKGTNRMVIADDNGTFMFNGLPENGILVISNIGYISQELKPVNGMVVKLVPATQELQDVVVSTGYQTLKKGSATGSFSVVTAKELNENPSINLLERLEGRIPGVQFDIRKNTIQIRGTNNYGNSTPPLVVIDGFPAINQNLTTISNGTVIGSPSSTIQTATSGNAILSTFNIADIETITFLKDAAASAIWGASAANGVIVITTKRGKRGSPSINFGSTVSISAPANFDNMTSMSNRQYIDLEQELFDKGFLTDPTSYYRNQPISEAQEWMFRVKRGTATTAQRDSALNVLSNRSNRGQIKDYLLQKAVTQQYNLSFSGGGENSSYYVSGNYTKDRPVFKSNLAENYTMTSNLTNDFLNKRLSVKTGLSYNYAKSQVNSAALQALSIGSYGLAPYEMLTDDTGNRIYRGITFTKKVSDSLTNLGYLPWTYNAIDELNYNNTISTRNSVRVMASLEGTVTDWLKVSLSGQVQKGYSEQSLVQNQNSYVIRDLLNIGTTFSSARVPTYGVPLGSVYSGSRITSNDYSLRAQFNVNKNWNKNHHFDMLGGTEIRESTAQGGGQLLYGYDEDRSTSVNVNTTATGRYNTIYGTTLQLAPSDGTVYKTRRRYLSYFSNASYSFLGKYYVTGSVRFDDINILGVDRRDRAKPLWSSGLRWDIKKESFLKDEKWLNGLSIRATIGTGGNAPTSSNNYSTIGTSTDLITKLPAATISSPANQNIGWATTRMTNGGLDVDLLDHRLLLTMDVYRKKTYGLLLSLPINAAYGYATLSYNAGDLEGHGTDIGLTGQIISSKDWGWSSTFNFSYNTNNVSDTRFPNTSTSPGPALVSGYPVDNLFVFRWAGLDNTGQSQIYAADGSILKSAGSPSVKSEDRVYAGRTTAPYYGGFFNTFKYKDLSLSVSASYSLGHKFLLQTINQLHYPQGTSSQGLLSTSQALATRWRNPGDENTTNIPGLTGTSFNSINRYMNADINVRDAGNVRLQQIALNYNIPQYMLKKMSFIKGISLGLNVTNLGLLWVQNKEGINPDYQMTDVYTNLPPSRTYQFSLNLSL